MILYLDWIAMGLTLGQMYLLGHHRVWGWPVGLAGSALWAAWALSADPSPLWSILAINAVLAVLGLRGWYRWRMEGRAVGVAAKSMGLQRVPPQP